ncbi:MAG: NifB/NifX family molybdenum-iron cluster-binding protein [Candidatus Methanomethylicia archaeon]
MKYLVPIENDNGAKSKVSMHFGRASYYAIVTFNPSSNSVEVNIKSAPDLLHGEVCDAATLVSRPSVDAIVVKGIGPKAVSILESMGVKVYTTNAQFLSEVIKEIKDGLLTSLKSSSIACRHGEMGNSQCRSFHYPFPIAPPLPLSYLQPAFTCRTSTSTGRIRVAVATIGHDGLDDYVAPQFARCSTFTIVDVENKKIANVEVRDNIHAMQPHGVGFATVQFLAGLGVNVVVSNRFGPNASQALTSLGIQIQIVPAGVRVREALRFLTG